MSRGLPRVNFTELSEQVERSPYFVQAVAPATPKEKSFPAIPPKLSAVGMTAPEDPDDNASWYVFLSFGTSQI